MPQLTFVNFNVFDPLSSVLEAIQFLRTNCSHPSLVAAIAEPSLCIDRAIYAINTIDMFHKQAIKGGYTSFTAFNDNYLTIAAAIISTSTHPVFDTIIVNLYINCSLVSKFRRQYL